MARTTPQQAADKWARRTAGATQDYVNGVNAVSSSPMDAAAQSANLYAQKVQEAVTSGRYQAGLRKVSLQSWKDSAVQKGAPRLASGVQAAQGKFGAFMQSFLPFEETVAQQVRSMPKGSLEDGVARAAAQIRGNAAYRQQR